MRELRLRIDSSLDAVREIGAAVRMLCDEAGVASDEAGMIELAVVEATTNAVKHGYGGAAGGHVDVFATLDDDRAVIEISDTGTPIPPHIAASASVPPLVDPTDRRSLPERGMGLSIITQVMDEVSFETSAGRNSLRMTRRWRH